MNPISDLEYNLVTTLSNLLQGREVLEKYAKDAEAAGDKQAADLFRQLREYNEEMAVKFRARLGAAVA